MYGDEIYRLEAAENEARFRDRKGGCNMKANKLYETPMKQLVEDDLEITKLNPITDDNGNLVKVVVEYTPKKGV